MKMDSRYSLEPLGRFISKAAPPCQDRHIINSSPFRCPLSNPVTTCFFINTNAQSYPLTTFLKKRKKHTSHLRGRSVLHAFNNMNMILGAETTTF